MDTIFYVVCLESGEVKYSTDPVGDYGTDGEGNALRNAPNVTDPYGRTGTLRSADGQDMYAYFDRYNVALHASAGGYLVQAVAGDAEHGVILEEFSDIDGLTEALDIVSAITRRYEGMI